MPMAEYECIFATNEPFRGYRFCYDEDKGFHVRVYEARLPISADMIFADFDTPVWCAGATSHTTPTAASQSGAWCRRSSRAARCAA